MAIDPAVYPRMAAQVDALEALLANDDAVARARWNQSQATLEQGYARVRAASARQRLIDQGIIQPPNAAPTRPTATIARPPNPVNRPVNAPARPSLPTSSPNLPNGGGILGALTVAGYAQAGLQAEGLVEQFGEDLEDWVGDNLIPSSVRPTYDRIADGIDRVRGLTPTAGATDLARAMRGLPPINPVHTLAPAITCSLFGVGCTGETADGIPFAGDQPTPYGGQEPGRQYLIKPTVTLRGQAGSSNDGKTVTFTSSSYISRPGPIINLNNIAIGTVVGGVSGATSHLQTGSGTVSIPATVQVGTPQQTNLPNWIYSNRTLEVIRADGLPDVAGNPLLAPNVQNPREISPAQPQYRPANHPQTRPGTASPQPIAAPAPSPATQPLTGIPGNSPSIAPPLTADPIAPTPTAPPPQAEQPDSPAAPPGGNRPWWFVPALVAAPIIASPLSRLNGGQARPSGPRIGTASPPTSPTCSYDSLGISGQVNLTNTTLNTIQTVQLAAMQATLNRIDGKLGPALDGGISSYLQKFWKWFYIDRIMNLITMWTTIHNAYMLSNGIAQSLFGVFDIVFQIFNFGLKDDEGNDIDTSGWVGEQFDTFFKQIFGDDNVDEVRRQWNRWNRIYQAAANIVNAVQSIMYSIAEGMEVIGNYVAKIGNAAKKYGVVVERAYNWMNPNLNIKQNKFFQRLQQVQEGVEALEVVASEALNVIEMKQEIDRQSTELKDLLTDKEQEMQEDHMEGVRNSTPPRAPTVRETDETPPLQEA